MATSKPTNNLPALAGQSFALTSGASKVELPAEFAGHIDQSDNQGYEAPRESLPIVSIRQKDLRDDASGKVKEQAGGFRIYDSLAKSESIHIPDISGEKGLLITVLADQTSRTYWQNVSDAKPTCKSIDGVNGVGNPGKVCASCEFSQWHGDDRPKCSAEINLLVYDNIGETCYVLRVGRSGIRHYNNLKTLIKRTSPGIPVHALKIRVLTQYEKEPQPHFVPKFIVEGNIELPLFLKMKELRHDLSILRKSAAINTVDEEHPAVASYPRNDNGDLSQGVMPVGDGDDDMPF